MRRLDQKVKPVGTPYNEGYLDRGLHQLHYTETGNPDGIPVIWSHGGPGAGQGPRYRRMFDMDKWRFIQMSQRGTGESNPKCELRDNTWRESIEDMEALREELDIKEWLVAGASWGSTLSILYAEAFPARCLGLYLVCMWLGRQIDVDFWRDSASGVFPECFDELVAELDDYEREDIEAAYARRVLGDDEEAARRAAQIYFDWHFVTMSFAVPIDDLDIGDPFDIMKVYFHYLGNRCFLEPNQLLENCAPLKDMPIKVIQGRYDMCTPMFIAWDFKKTLPHVDLRAIDMAGHQPMERNLLHAAIDASNDFHSELES